MDPVQSKGWGFRVRFRVRIRIRRKNSENQRIEPVQEQ